MIDGYEQVYRNLSEANQALLLKNPHKLVQRTATRAKKSLQKNR
jgi:hypothetical protein